MTNEHWKEDDDYQLMKFDKDSITLKVPINPPLEEDNWKIVPRSSPLKVGSLIM